MRITVSRLVIPTLGLLAACVPSAVERSAPAPENALSCAQESLRRLGYSNVEMAKSGTSFYARRTADSAAVTRVEHLVNVSTRTNGSRTLQLRGERLFNKEVGLARAGEAPADYRVRMEADDVLKSEISQVIRDCGEPAPHSPAAAL
jgi:hypothetical protein